MNSTSLAGRLILVCEDQPLVALDIANAFTEVGARVVTARSLRDALIAVEDGTLSAAILDHALGDGDSSQLGDRLRERNIPFVVYSGFSNLDGAYGDAVHVPKPASSDVLVTTVVGLLQRRPTLHLKM
jgi:DNA-binding response OmpR family regulator